MIIKNKIITMEDVNTLNNSTNATIVLPNTVGQNSDIIAKLSNNVRIFVIGGYDPTKYEKYKIEKYIDRTLYTPEQLSTIIKVFDKVEKNINPQWSDTEKALYVYLNFIKGIEYDYSKNNTKTNSNLCALITSKAKCAGFATCFKEEMDRLGIENEFKNIPGIHSYNAVKLDGFWHIIDVTWGRCAFDEYQKGECSINKILYHFGQNDKTEILYSFCDEPQNDYHLFLKEDIDIALKKIYKKDTSTKNKNDELALLNS